MNKNRYIYNTYSTIKANTSTCDEPREERLERRGRPRKERTAPLLPSYVARLCELSPNQITDLVCSGVADPIYIEDWSGFSDLDKARIIVKHPNYFYEFRNPYVSSFSSTALTYLISKKPELASRLHTLHKLSVAEWEYILKKHPHMIEDCPYKKNLSMTMWLHIILNYDFAHCVFSRWDMLTKKDWKIIFKKRPNYISKYCSDVGILNMMKAIKHAS